MKALFMTILLCCHFWANGQGQPKYFQKTLEPWSDIHDIIIVEPHNEHYIAFGRYTPLTQAYAYAYGLILDNYGNIIHQEIYNNINTNSNINSIFKEDNTYICAGTSFNNSIIGDTGFLQIINDTCLQTDLFFIESDLFHTGFFGISPTINNSYTMGGFSIIYTPNYDPWVAYAAKTTATGEVLWQHRYSADFDTTKQSYIAKILTLPQSSDMFYLGLENYDDSGNPIQCDIFLARVDSAGAILWKNVYNIGSRDAAGHVAWTPDQKMVFVGVYGPPTGGRRGLIGKVDTLGNLIWWHALEEIHLVEDFVMVNEGQAYVLAGIRAMPPLYIKTNLCIAKTDSSGNVLWARDYGGSENDYGYCIAPTNDGGYLVMGRKDSSAIGKALVYMVKTNCMGLLTEPTAAFTAYQTGDSPLEVGFQNLSQYVYPDSIDGGYYVWDFGDGSPPFMCGQGYGACPALLTHNYAAQGQYTATLTAFVCTDTATATQQFSVVPTAVGQVAAPRYHISVLPNPASEVLHLEAVGALSSSHELQFSLYDAMGRAVRRLALRANAGSVRLGIADLPQGLYFWTCYSPDMVLQSGRVVIGNE